jgi:hypothetical protein
MKQVTDKKYAIYPLLQSKQRALYEYIVMHESGQTD